MGVVNNIGFVCLAALLFAAAAAVFYKSRIRPVIQFLSAEEMQRVITDDADNYYDKFHTVDYKVRDVTNRHTYLEKIAKSGCAAESDIIEKVRSCIETVHRHLSATNGNETIHGIDIAVFLNIPWRIGFTCDKKYENGLPHTRGDVIILNNKDIQRRTVNEVCKLLIHEKSHVYQKTKKENISAYLKTNYTEVKRKDYKDKTIPANPDIDDIIYKCNKTNMLLEGKYRENPTHFRDVVFTQNNHALEHPFERIAYGMEDLFY